MSNFEEFKESINIRLEQIDITLVYIEESLRKITSDIEKLESVSKLNNEYYF